jgi:hypothetical protein
MNKYHGLFSWPLPYMRIRTLLSLFLLDISWHLTCTDGTALGFAVYRFSLIAYHYIDICYYQLLCNVFSIFMMLHSLPCDCSEEGRFCYLHCMKKFLTTSKSHYLLDTSHVFVR